MTDWGPRQKQELCASSPSLPPAAGVPGGGAAPLRPPFGLFLGLLCNRRTWRQREEGLLEASPAAAASQPGEQLLSFPLAQHKGTKEAASADQPSRELASLGPCRGVGLAGRSELAEESGPAEGSEPAGMRASLHCLILPRAGPSLGWGSFLLLLLQPHVCACTPVYPFTSTSLGPAAGQHSDLAEVEVAEGTHPSLRAALRTPLPAFPSHPLMCSQQPLGVDSGVSTPADGSRLLTPAF